MSTVPLSQTADQRYTGYAYAYPHKTAYRPIVPAIPLRDVWRDEPKDALSLYVHLPFCEMRCGFCNLFTLAQPQDDLVSRYLQTLEFETSHAATALGPVRIAQLAIGGGTPTFLNVPQLDRLFAMVRRRFGTLGRIPISVETSPRTSTLEKMQLLKSRGVSRVSIGVQSFVESEVASCGRAQRNAQVEQAIAHIRHAKIAILNLDLIYGLPNQTVNSWLESLRIAVSFAPEELYLYPLYVRPLTGIARREVLIDDHRAECYAAGCQLLGAAGYEQVSMRMFRRRGGDSRERSGDARERGPVYCCQDDGMVGLGCGARSYTRALHYSREFAVGRDSVKSILRNYIDRSPASFCVVDYGCRLDLHEQCRRYIIKSILRFDGLPLAEYRARFRSDPIADVPELQELIAQGCLVAKPGSLTPTQKGIDHSDAIGPALFSPEVHAAMEGFELR